MACLYIPEAGEMTDLDALPQNIEVEQAVLGGVLLEGGVINQVLEILNSEDFYTKGLFSGKRVESEMKKWKAKMNGS
jgi:hypothetical protein